MERANLTSGSGHPLRPAVVAALRMCIDPELMVSIYELGLVYAIRINGTGNCEIQMTLTSPACPVAEALPKLVEARVRDVDGIGETRVEIVWDPPWSADRLPMHVKLQLGLL